MPGVVVSISSEALVIRFRPTEAAAVLRSAQREYRRAGHHGVSVFADVRRAGESDESLRARLLAASELSGIDPSNNTKYWVCTRAQELQDRTFTFLKDEYEDELPEHYCVSLGADPDIEAVQRFLEPFGTVEVRGR